MLFDGSFEKTPFGSTGMHLKELPWKEKPLRCKLGFHSPTLVKASYLHTDGSRTVYDNCRLCKRTKSKVVK